MIDTRNGLMVARALTLMGLGSGTASGQWTSDTAANTVVCDHASNQNQPKVRGTSDGGCYISWLDGQAAGWDVRLQRLDAKGNELWAHNGVQVADLTLSSTNDYGLAVDASDNALMSFQDSRFGGTIITATLVAPNGNQLWGPTGVQVSTASGFSPRACVTTDSHYIVGWTEGTGFRLQRLNAAGGIQYAVGGISFAPVTGSYSLSDLKPADFGRYIALWVRPTGNINSPRHLYAQKFGPGGAPQWNSGNPRIIYDAASVQNGYFPTFITTPGGDAIFGWYENGGPRNAYVQRVDTAGNEVFAHGGIGVSSAVTTFRGTGNLAFDQSTGDMYFFWVETNANPQNAWGVYGQKVDASGALQWGANGKELVALSALQPSFVSAAALSGDGVIVAWFDGSGLVMTAKVDGNGDFEWRNSPLQACSTSASKARLDLGLNACGEAMMVWSDGRVPLDGGDIYAQNIHPDGEFGNNRDGDTNDDGVVDIDDLVVVITGWGNCGKTCPGDVAPINGCAHGNDVVDIDDLVVVITNWG